jgi:hypothetical protein
VTEDKPSIVNDLLKKYNLTGRGRKPEDPGGKTIREFVVWIRLGTGTVGTYFEYEWAI